MREKTVENYLRQEVKKAGGLCEKHVSPGQNGVPDRLVTWPERFGAYQHWADKPAVMHLVETKAPDGVVSDAQERDHARRAKIGVKVHVIWTKGLVDLYVAFNRRDL